MKKIKKLNKRIEEKIGEKKLMKIKKGLKVAKIVKNVVLTILIIVLVFTVITFLLARVNGGTPSVFGYSIHRVETGSMEPALHVGDVFLSKDVEDPKELQVNDIITFQGGTKFGNNHVTHRVYTPPYENEQGEWVLVTKGDANEIVDGEVELSKVESKYQRKLEFLQKLYSFFFSPWGLIIFVFALILIFFDEVLNIARVVTKNDNQEKEESIGEIIERIQREEAEKLAKETQDSSVMEEDVEMQTETDSLDKNLTESESKAEDDRLIENETGKIETAENETYE